MLWLMRMQDIFKKNIKDFEEGRYDICKKEKVAKYTLYGGSGSSNRHLKIDVYGKRPTASEFFILQLYYNGFYKSFKIY